MITMESVLAELSENGDMSENLQKLNKFRKKISFFLFSKNKLHVSVEACHHLNPAGLGPITIVKLEFPYKKYNVLN